MLFFYIIFIIIIIIIIMTTDFKVMINNINLLLILFNFLHKNIANIMLNAW